jgi:hypothetical protein
MKEENKLRSSVHAIEDEVGLQRKMTRFCKHSEVDECLYKWLWRWNVQHGICKFNTEGESASVDNVAAEQFPETVHKAIADGGYTDEELYNCDETALYYKLLPNESSDLKTVPSTTGMKTNKERATLLLCANKTGNHKLKSSCISKNQSPRCFKHVNMNSQPVIYKTSNIFASWF